MFTDSVRLACQQPPSYPPVSAKAFLSEFQKFSEISFTSSIWTWAFYKPKGVLTFSDLGSSPWCFSPDNSELILAPCPNPAAGPPIPHPLPPCQVLLCRPEVPALTFCSPTKEQSKDIQRSEYPLQLKSSNWPSTHVLLTAAFQPLFKLFARQRNCPLLDCVGQQPQLHPSSYGCVYIVAWGTNLVEWLWEHRSPGRTSLLSARSVHRLLVLPTPVSPCHSRNTLRFFPSVGMHCLAMQCPGAIDSHGWFIKTKLL